MNSHTHLSRLGGLSLCFGAALASPSLAASIPYSNQGTQNAASYVFKASGGDITGYFVGTQAGYNETFGLLVNGSPVASGIFPNQTTASGTKYDFGSFAKGSILTFFIDVKDTGATFYSNKSLNLDGAQHVYSTAYPGSSSGGVTIPAGTYISFEDLAANRSLYPKQDYDTDFDYNDDQFVFTNVAVTNVPIPASAPMFGAALLAVGAAGYAAKRKRAAATA